MDAVRVNGDPPLAAAILVGGQSRRMGTNKALLRLAPDGLTVIELVVAAVQHVTTEVVLVGAQPDQAGYPKLPWVPDDPTGIGPLGGIQAALASAHHDRLLIVACDMPFLEPALLRYMAAQPPDYDLLLPEIGQQLQPMHAIYHRSSLPVITRHLAGGDYRVQGWFGEANLTVIPETTVAQHDPSLHSCLNLNTPADLALARHIFTEQPSLDLLTRSSS